MGRSKKTGLVGFIIVLAAIVVFLQVQIDPQRKQFEPGHGNTGKAISKLPIEFALGAALGFREAIAGLLWVRTDEFFHEGNYDAIVPMVRIITWLDPHNIDVYSTGAWHLDYNFTDASQRSDRRYIPFALALMEEAIANNPTDSTLYADLAFTHYYRKIADFPKAVEWFVKGQQLRTSEPNWDVTAVGHGLAHAYEATGHIDEAIAEWKLCIDEHQRKLKTSTKETYSIDHQGLIVAQRNYDEDIARKKWRATMVNPPANFHFSATLTRVAPMVFDLNGTMNTVGAQNFVLETGAHKWAPTDGARVEIRLQDADYVIPQHQVFGLNAALQHDVSILQDSVSVTKSKFHKHLDMSTDHYGADPMYSFKAPKYTLTLWFNPASMSDSPLPVGDRIGWMGQGLTDDKYLDTSGVVPGTTDLLPGVRLIKKTFTLTRDDIMGKGEKSFK